MNNKQLIIIYNQALYIYIYIYMKYVFSEIL